MTPVSLSTTQASGKMYPSILRQWTEFPQLHHTRFATLQRLLEDAPVLPSLNSVKSTFEYLYPLASKEDNPVII